MGQSLKTSRERSKSRSEVASTDAWEVAVFSTDLGWFALTGRGHAVAGLTIGHATEGDALSSAGRRHEALDNEPRDWNPALRRRLERYARGERDEFDDVELVLPAMTAFQAAIVQATRDIGFGNTRSYSELAEAAGYPRAARAVGNVMAANRIPVLIPCHRVVAAGEKLGGFSAPQGVNLKRRMLQLEAEIS